MTDSETIMSKPVQDGILIADDSKVMRRVLQELFDRSGYKVLGQATNGLEAVDFYMKHRPAIVIMDINMPGIDGLEATKRIIQYDPDAVIIVVSANSEKEKVYEAVVSGAIKYLIKPVDPNRLLEVIRELESARK